MKLKDTYYRKNGFVNTNFTKNSWLRYRFGRWFNNIRFQCAFGIEIKPKHRHRRTWAVRNRFKIWGHESIKTVLYSRPAKPIGRKKRGKWLYMPKRIAEFVEGWD